MSVLEVAELRVDLPGTPAVLDGVSLRLEPGECLAVVGSSGAGKSVLVRTLLGLTQDDPSSHVAAKMLRVAGVELSGLRASGRRALRARSLGFVPQDALQSLDPLRTVEKEVGEALAVQGVPRRERRARILAALAAAGLPDAEELLPRRSDELSGGMRQRVLIAAATVSEPMVLCADEPTTALDATTGRQVLNLLGTIRDRGTGVLLISHDLDAAARIADRVVVLDGGRIVEEGPAGRVLGAPRTAVGRALADATPRGAKPTPAPAGTPFLLGAERVTRSFRRGAVTALDGVSLRLHRGESLGLVGESGSGKSTLARLLLGRERPDSGRILTTGAVARLVPQDALASFDPRLRVGDILRFASGASGPRPGVLLDRVGLDAALATRMPATLSGGQRQRVAIARALASSPEVVVCDEAVSALDRTAQAEIVELLLALIEREGLAMLFISHDLALVRRVSDRVMVLQKGRVVEEGATEKVWASPVHRFTRQLLAAAR